MRGNGLIIICMGKEFIHGRMAESTKGIIKMIKSMVMELIHGLIVSFLF